MNTRAFSLAIVIAALAMFMVFTYIEDQKSALIRKYGVEKSVLVAKVEIGELELIDDSKVTLINIPQTYVAPGHFKSVKDIENTVATVPILKGEQITRPRVTYPGSKTGLSRQIGVGKRAMAINISEGQAVGHLIKPGDRVDVLAPIDYASGRKDMQKLFTILQDVLILSTGFKVTNSIPIIGVETPSVVRQMNLNTYNKYSTVTLELDPYQAQKLAFMLTYSGYPPLLSLRNNNDKKIVRIRPTKIFDVLGEDASQAKTYFLKKYQKKVRRGPRGRSGR